MIKLTSSQVKSFVGDACTEIERSHDYAWNDITTGTFDRSRYEAQFVARLCAGARDIAVKWRPRIRKISPSVRLSFASIFTHQSPYVEWPPVTHSNRCELADLLIAVIDRNSSPPFGRAVLVQAKQSDSGATNLTSKSEQKQFDLLSSRPIFDVDAVPAPRGVNLSPMSPDDSLQYGLNPPDSTPATPSSWSTHRWNMADGLGTSTPYLVTTGSCLADWLVEQLQSKRGWKFKLPPTSKDWTYFTIAPHCDDWSALVNYLLEVTFKKPLTQLAQAGTVPDRGLDEPLCLVGSAPRGRTMFAVFDLDSREQELLPQWSPRFGTVTQGPTEWSSVDSVSSIPWGALSSAGGIGGGEREQQKIPLVPDNGPISTILFQIEKSGSINLARDGSF